MYPYLATLMLNIPNALLCLAVLAHGQSVFAQSAASQEVLCLVNTERAARGISLLRLNPYVDPTVSIFVQVTHNARIAN